MAATKIVIRREDFQVNHLFADSKYFLEEAMKYDAKDESKARTFIRASIITSSAALEALANALLTLLDATEDLELHERAFAQEKRVEFGKEGHFEIKGHHFPSLEDKIRFLYWRRKGDQITITDFINATKLRNKLVHPRPREMPYSELTVPAARSCYRAAARVAQLLGWPTVGA